MPYSCEVVYKPGRDSENPADFLSRHPTAAVGTPADNNTETYVNYMCHNLSPKAMTIDEVKEETAKDPILYKLSVALNRNTWFDPDVKSLLNVKDELSFCNGLVLRSNRLVLPQSACPSTIPAKQSYRTCTCRPPGYR
jgi:hypothetical protein